MKILYCITGKIYVPGDLIDSSVKILHISDTPSMIYKDILKLLKMVQPDILIHTGDIADEVKLEGMPQQIARYKARAADFLRSVGRYVKERIIIVPGNHDDEKVIGSIRNIEVYKEGSIIEAYGKRIGLAHMFDRLPENCDYYMYGHDKTVVDYPGYLNGLDSISILKIEKNETVKLFYPKGTDDFRFRRIKIGI